MSPVQDPPLVFFDDSLFRCPLAPVSVVVNDGAECYLSSGTGFVGRHFDRVLLHPGGEYLAVMEMDACLEISSCLDHIHPPSPSPPGIAVFDFISVNSFTMHEGGEMSGYLMLKQEGQPIG